MILILKKAELRINTLNEMRYCSACEGLLDDSLFQAEETVCRICRIKLRRDEDVDYAEPAQKTIKQAYISLLLAIHKQACFDNALPEWEKYWLDSVEWGQVWELFKTSTHGKSIRNVLLQLEETR